MSDVNKQLLALANEVRDAVIAEITKDSIISITGAVIKRAKHMDLSVIVERCAAVPEGYALVPIEPTQAMLCAGQKEWLESTGADPSFDIYRSMLSAAQKGGA